MFNVAATAVKANSLGNNQTNLSAQQQLYVYINYIHRRLPCNGIHSEQQKQHKYDQHFQKQTKSTDLPELLIEL